MQFVDRKKNRLSSNPRVTLASIESLSVPLVGAGSCVLGRLPMHQVPAEGGRSNVKDEWREGCSDGKQPHFQPRGCEFESPQEQGGNFLFLEGKILGVSIWKQPLYPRVRVISTYTLSFPDLH